MMMINNSTQANTEKYLSYGIKIFTLAILYFVAGKLSFSVAQSHSIVTVVIFAAEGFALSAVILFGRGIWPGIFLGQLALALSEGLSTMPALAISAINSIEAIIAVMLFHHFKLKPSLERLKDVFGLLLIIALVLQPFSATLGNTVLWMSSLLSWQDYPTSWFSWWFGNTLGQMLVAPMVLLLYAARKEINRREAILIGLFFGILGYSLFRVIPAEGLALTLSITSPLIVILAIFRGAGLASLATTILAAESLYATHNGFGPFSHNGVINIVDLNYYIFTLIILSLFIGVLVTILKQQSKDLEKNIKRLDFALITAHQGWFDLNIQTGKVTVSDEYARLLGFKPKYFHPNYQRWVKNIHPDDRDFVLKSFQECIDTGKPQESEYRIRSRSNEWLWMHSIGDITERDSQNNPLRMIGIHTDITERKLAEEALQTSRKRFQTIFEEAPLGVAVIDSQTGHIYDANPAYATIAGRSIEELRTLDWMTITHPDDIQEDIDNMSKMNAGETSGFTMQKRYIQPDSSERWINMTIAPMQVEDKSKPRHLCMTEDITQNKLVEISLEESESRLLEAQKYARIGHWELLADQKTASWSDQMYELFGLSTGVQPGPESLCSIVNENDFPTFVKSVQDSFKTGNEHHVEYRIKRPNDGKQRWIECRGKIVKDEDGEPKKISGFIQDITERKLVEEKLQLSSRVFSETSEGITITNAQKEIVDVNPAFCEITGYSRDEVLGQNPRILSSGKQSPQFYEDMWQTIDEHRHWQGEIWNRTKSGELYAELLNISTVLDEHGNILNYVGVFTDITHSKHQQEELSRMAHYDVLTQLPNRTLLLDRFHQATAHSKRSGNQLAICFLDLDKFKPINDSHGHEVGDQLLQEVANRIKDTIREEDTVSRQGGDEFALLLGEIESFTHCEQFLDRLLETIAQPYVIDGTSHQISASCGITLYPFDDADLDTLLRHADHAMYQAKQAGRNRHRLFSVEDDAFLTQKQQQLNEIEQALSNNEFSLYYQPKVNMLTGEVFGAEALIRWIHPEKGLIPPLDFLPAIEHTEIELKIGDWVINQALTQLEEWNSNGIKLEVSINISSHHLQSKLFYNQLDKALANHPSVDSKSLQLEILESSALGDLDAISGIIKTCQDALGVNIALDDFGTGYSSLTHLRHLSANTIKIDQSFVRDMLDDPSDYAIIEGVIGLANAFNREFIAEGVETTEHGLMLLIMGCEDAQGYGIAKPMPAEDVSDWLSNYQPNNEWRVFGNKNRTDRENKLTLFQLITERWLHLFTANIASQAEKVTQWPNNSDKRDHCSQWIKREKQDILFDKEVLLSLEQAHKDFHLIAQSLQLKYQQGDIESAREDLPKLQSAFDEMRNVLAT